MNTPKAPLAAILYERGDKIEELLAAAAAALRAHGVRVGGLVQHSRRSGDDVRCTIEVESIADGRRYLLSQDTSDDPTECTLDTAVLAEASGALRQALAQQVDLVIVNKFGKQEAAGRGLRGEILQIALAGVPLLTTVSRRHLPQWQEFIGDDVTLLEPALPAVLAWWNAHTGPAAA